MPMLFASPVVPSTPRLLQPFASNQRQCAAMRSRSTDRSARIGVSTAAFTPANRASVIIGCLLWLTLGARHAAGPIDDVMVKRPGLALIHGAPAHRNAGLMHGVGIAGHQRMPPRQVLALR